MGLGQGVSLGLTTYDADERLLVLSTGEQYRVEETGTKVVLLQHKLDTAHVTRDEKRNLYRIAHKSGEVEILTGPKNAFGLKVPTALLTSAGHCLELAWDFTAGPSPRLKEISDRHGTLLKVAYVGQSKATLHVLPGSETEGYDIDLRFRNGLLGSVHHFALGQDEPLVWEFTHTEVGSRGEWGSWITGVAMPGGMREAVWYRDDGHRFPVSADMPPLPYVYRSMQVPGGGQPPSEVSYSYTDTNFLGGHSEVDWDSSRDCLYDVLTDYSYGSTESRTCAGQTTRVTRTYNKYHLQTAEKHQQNHCSRTVETQYYAATGKSFEKQVPQFQLPRTRTVTWRDSQSPGPTAFYQEVTETTFDEFGNPLARTDPDGTRTVWDYYPADGSGDDCPPEPDKFTRFPRSVTRTPPQTDFDAPAHTTAYRYRAYTATPHQEVLTDVLKSEEQLRVDEHLVRKQVFDYSTSEVDFGRLTRRTTTEYPDGGGNGFESVETFGSSATGDLVEVHELKSHDGLTLKSSQTHSPLTGRLSEATDPQSNRVTMDYDKLGRLLKHTANPGTPYEAVERHSYETGTSAPFVATSTDALGNRTRESFDGAGRLIRRERQDSDGDSGSCGGPGNGQWHTVDEQSYDEQGRLASVTVLDHVRASGETSGGEIKCTSRYAYDDWGQCSTTTLDDGSGEHTLHDPVSRTTTTQRLDAGKPMPARTVTTYDKRGLPASITRLDRSGSPTGTRTFKHDGSGRLRSATDELGAGDEFRHTTTYDYDSNDRLRRTTLPDQTQVTRSYAPFSADRLVTELTVGTTPYGTQTFDGLGRRRSTTSGGRTWSYTYGADSDRLPSTCRAPDGRPFTYTYIRQLADALSQVTAGEGTGKRTQKFTLHPITAAVVEAEEGGVTVSQAYYPSGLPCATTTRLPDHPGITTHTTFTVNGLEQTLVGVDGTVRHISRDTFGRLLAVVDPAAWATLRYDTAGRVTGWTTKDSGSNVLTTDLVLDDFGREVTRTLTDGQGSTWILTQQWQTNDLLARRTLKRGATVLRDETFTYTSRNQLSTYKCTGQTPPQDAHGRAITGQTFTYDPYGNVTTCRTGFDGGTDTATYVFGNEDDPCQLTGIDHDNPKSHTDLSYDKAGRLVTDETGRTLGYDEFGRLIAVGKAAAYGYDPLNQLLTQSVGGSTSVFSYHRQALASITDGDQHTRLVRLGSTCVAQHREGVQTSTILFGADGKQTVLVATETGKQSEEYAYTPYGDRRPAAAESVLGHDGERADPATGCYHLGNGYRAYNPLLMRFTVPDSLSPFGGGGINPYAYCLGDPINRTDPTGHLSWGAWLSIGVGIAGIGLAVFTGGASIAAATGVWATVAAAGLGLDVASSTAAILSGALEGAAPGASGILGWVSIGTGAAGIGSGIGARIGSVIAARALSRLAAQSAAAAKATAASAVAAAEAEAAAKGGAALARFYGTFGENVFGGDTAPAAAGSAARAAEAGPSVESAVQGAVGGEAAATVNVRWSGARPTMFHYTTKAGRRGILRSLKLRPSLEEVNPDHAKFGDGVYVTHIPPDWHDPRQLSNLLAHTKSIKRFSDFVEFDVTGLKVVPVTASRPAVSMIKGSEELDLTGRIVKSGVVRYYHPGFI
ncbi:RHS repeat-associated core domain-containing protein [Streptomyces millisiae]|uniref:RHS repeat-associated core domain-containing protein n=1 Tax=Streptomyces millisiae TaxID=3075542 RepID=A0ABU2LW91_9ACTN|nr:RHS repeat-associated core domain-containing protein [Streptomyces sp. DSM 44918]MDT0321859.1 RHS repeat-associated core domain-containing protein [Streptomyces sp. DSM 44918]